MHRPQRFPALIRANPELISGQTSPSSPARQCEMVTFTTVYDERSCRDRLRELEVRYPDWFLIYDMMGGEHANIADLEFAMQTAPHEMLAMMVYTALSIRRITSALDRKPNSLPAAPAWEAEEECKD